MKKLFSFVAILVLSFFSGVFLTACDENVTWKISVNKVAEEASLYTVTVKVGGAVLDSNEGVYEIKQGSHAKVEILANDYGVDMSQVQVKVGNIKKEIVKNDEFKIVPPQTVGSRDHLYGSFSLQNINTDMTIFVSGVKEVSSEFEFQTTATNINGDEKIAMTQICTSVNDEFVELSEFLTSTNPSYERTYDKTDGLGNTYRTFKVRFDGKRPFDVELYDSYGNRNDVASLFKIKAEGESEFKDVENIVWSVSENCYIVDLGNIGESKKYIIMVDFSNLEYKRYPISYARNGIGYSVSLDINTSTYDEERIVTIAKTLTQDEADYQNMRVFVGSVELQKISGSETDTEVKFLMPKGLTPLTTGGLNVYTIGVDLDVEKYSLSSYSEREEYLEFSEFITPQFFTMNLDGGFESSASENGNKFAMAGQTVAMRWLYRYDEGENLYSATYQLHDYDIYVGLTKILNVKEVLSGAQQDIEQDLENGYIFKAKYNTERGQFDQFELSFECSDDAHFEFKNFKMFAKNVNISYNFEDPRAQKVEYRILENSGEEVVGWTELEKNSAIAKTVAGGYIVEFRIATNGEAIATNEYKLEDSCACNMEGSARTESDEDFTYTIFSYYVSSLQFTNTANMKLVPAGAI